MSEVVEEWPECDIVSDASYDVQEARINEWTVRGYGCSVIGLVMKAQSYENCLTALLESPHAHPEWRC